MTCHFKNESLLEPAVQHNMLFIITMIKKKLSTLEQLNIVEEQKNKTCFFLVKRHGVIQTCQLFS